MLRITPYPLYTEPKLHITVVGFLSDRLDEVFFVGHTYAEVPGDVGSSQDPGGRREEDSKHGEEGLVVPEVWAQVFHKYSRCGNDKASQTSSKQQLARRKTILANR